MTKDYFSTKRVTAWPADRDGQVGMAIKYADGYQSWCPKDVFDREYQPITAMSFGAALVALKRGGQVARAGWNGKGMHISLVPGSSEYLAPDRSRLIGGVSENHFALGDSGTVTRMPHLAMRAADGSIVTGWLASQTDMLAEDWMIVGE
ncbi:hypothetical protein BN1110_06294 [bacterium YEK0313]|nr:hypothetical protein BN1110_06294 [bacterium YEK0313]